VLIRTRVSEVREMGRSTQGVTLIALDSGERLAGLETVVDSDEDAGNGNADAGPEGSAGPDAGGDGAGGDAPAA
jgi:DNA gyrase subunit A